MNLTVWNPFREMEEFFNRYNRRWNLGSLANAAQESMTVADWAPAVDISETESEFIIKAELPEVNKDDVKVTIDGGVLTIQGERKAEKEEKGVRHHRIERFFGHFERSFTLPDTVREDEIKAEFRDGLLTVHLTKQAKSKPKAIEVKVAA